MDYVFLQKNMNRFYAIAQEGEEAHEFEIPFFGDVIAHNQIYSAGGRSIGIEKVYKPATSAEYDMKFRSAMYSLKPIFKVPLFLDYQLNRYEGNSEEFLSQIRYVILPLVDRGTRKNYADIIRDWLDSKNPKSESKNLVISTGHVYAPMQIQNASNHSNQTQNINQSQEKIQELFALIRQDIENLDKEIRQDFELEMDYAVKQLTKEKDIRPQLSNLGELVKNVGLPIFTDLTSSSLFEIIKPFVVK